MDLRSEWISSPLRPEMRPLKDEICNFGTLMGPLSMEWVLSVPVWVLSGLSASDLGLTGPPDQKMGTLLTGPKPGILLFGNIAPSKKVDRIRGVLLGWLRPPETSATAWSNPSSVPATLNVIQKI